MSWLQSREPISVEAGDELGHRIATAPAGGPRGIREASAVRDGEQGFGPSNGGGMKNVDLAAGILRIEQQTGRFYGQPGVRLLPLKTQAAERDVVVQPFARQILRWHRDVQRLESKRAQELEVWEEHGMVFCGTTGRLCFRSEPAAEFRRITTQREIEDATPHTVRHTVTTLVQETGLSLKVAQSLMGHAMERMTSRVYSHLTASELEGADEGDRRAPSV